VKSESATAIARLKHYVQPYRWALGTTLVLVIVVGILEAATPLLIGLVFDTVLGSAETPLTSLPLLNLELSVPPEYGMWVLAALVGVTVVKAAAEYGSVWATAFMGHSVVRDLRADLYRAIVRQPLGFFSAYPTGELMSRVSSDVERVQVAVSETLADFLKQSAILVSLLILLVAIHWRLTLYSLVLVPLVYFPSVWFGRRLRRLSGSNQGEMARMANVLFETFSGNRIVKIFTMETAEMGKFGSAAERVFRLGLRQRLTHALSSPLMEILGIGVVAGFLLYARAEIQAGRMTGGLFITFIVALIKLYDPIRRMSGINNSFQQAIGASNTLFDIMASPPEPDPGSRILERFDAEIEFRDVRFVYPEAKAPTIDGVSFRLVRGEVLALVGSSGAGKTTLVNLIPRFYDVTEGAIVIDGANLGEFTLDSLRHRIAMVTQDVILFNDTIRTNIAYGSPDASDAEIQAAARAALVDEFVSRLPDGYDTVIGERGARLSGGERQRISIARALLKNAPILILDEATSSLDAESEALVQQALENLIEGRTTIVIAHRLSTIRRADRILVLADGRVEEQGSHEELLTRQGLYWKLHKLQFEDVPS
jgi:subfamily B ATP-binding cassette protein MsbA